MSSPIFGGDQADGGSVADGATDSGEIGAGADISPTVSPHTELSRSCRDLDGMRHEWYDKAI